MQFLKCGTQFCGLNCWCCAWEIGLLFSFLGYLLKNSVCMFSVSCSRWLLMTVWSSMWSTIWSSMWSYAVWKQYPTNVDCFDSTIHLVVAIVALSTDCGFKVITTYFDATSHVFCTLLASPVYKKVTAPCDIAKWSLLFYNHDDLYTVS